MFVRYDLATGKPVSFPVSTAAVVAYLRAPSEDEALIKRLIARAFAAFAKYTNGHHASETAYEIFFDRYEVDGKKLIRLPVFPVSSESILVEAFTGADDSEEIEAVAFTGDQFVHLLDEPPSDIREHNGLVVKITVGYSDDKVPDDILMGIEQYIAFLYEARGDASVEIPENVASLWSPYIRYTL